MAEASMIDMIRLWVGCAALLVGAIGVIFGALGLLRLRDIYQRMHGAGIIDTGGAGLILFGLLLLVAGLDGECASCAYRCFAGHDQPNRHPCHCPRRAL